MEGNQQFKKHSRRYFAYWANFKHDLVQAVHLVELHPLLQGPGLGVGPSEDPELGLDQGAVGQIHPADVKVHHAVVRVGGRWLDHVWGRRRGRGRGRG